MREIKFRAWNGSKMRYKVNINDGKCVRYGYQWFNEGNDIYKSTPMQYIGQKDKNGEEIYCGDIISYPTKNQIRKGTVSLKDGIYGITTYARDVRDEQIPLIKFIRKHGVEVIGNIYENKNLLTK